MTFADEMQALTVAIANNAMRCEQERNKTPPCRSSRIFDTNKARVLAVMKGKGQLPIKEICRLTGLKRCTVYEHVQRLVEEKRVARIPLGARTHLFEFNKESA